mmetsp:Transcript_34383/g.75058  ORF Transcript_34383/g.75058 Transcript_34383/m.75058 type:complete len:217 (+) Transcript_34383:1870-2520(+)
MRQLSSRPAQALALREGHPNRDPSRPSASRPFSPCRKARCVSRSQAIQSSFEMNSAKLWLLSSSSLELARIERPPLPRKEAKTAGNFSPSALMRAFITLRTRGSGGDAVSPSRAAARPFRSRSPSMIERPLSSLKLLRAASPPLARAHRSVSTAAASASCATWAGLSMLSDGSGAPSASSLARGLWAGAALASASSEPSVARRCSVVLITDSCASR